MSRKAGYKEEIRRLKHEVDRLTGDCIKLTNEKAHAMDRLRRAEGELGHCLADLLKLRVDKRSAECAYNISMQVSERELHAVRYTGDAKYLLACILEQMLHRAREGFPVKHSFGEVQVTP